ncbi:FAD-binding oxidoreductase [Dechloromonas sp. HYN0024]|uniref:FAD-binding oxidoreductase n=1 Tax=Dechloromonas sp. HYN0024 TaxID=2231055 RepID=UPI000E4381B2|nr:FAD-binding oxidoreductase [Dechloromonas sp. HYN0024]AXS81449.1 FAD-binding oxidoreductase [Dechloromonas sp. HYN0024]
MTSTPRSSDLIAALAGIVGAQQVLTEPADIAPFVTDWRGRYRGAAQCVVRPGSTAEVAAVIKVCVEADVPIVPQGGNTSLCGAATPDEAGRAVVVSLSRMNRIIAIDPLNSTVTVEAGCTLSTVQDAARAVDRLFPLALASEGCCQIGGNLSTNAGGVQVLRYGNTRELTLGLEVVLPNGDIWDGRRGLRKDNTGYDLKHMFIGAEGTLGIITGAVLKLFPLPKKLATCWLNVASPEAAVKLLNSAKASFDAQLTAFELVSETALGLVLKHIPDTRRPSAPSPWYVLAEFSDADPAAVEGWLAERVAAEEVGDGAMAQSETQAKSLWSLRETISEAQKIEGLSIKHDVSVPVSRIAEFLARADAALEKAFPGVRVVAFGHVGDGNLHYNLSQPAAVDNAVLIAHQGAVNRLVHDTVHALNGSISAEHGIGQLKRKEILRYKSPVEMALMRSLKQALDPRGLMNPGKVL